jgi:hypothetical protein
MDLQELADREEIRAVVTRYTRLVDSDALTEGTYDASTVFTDDATLDYSSAGGPVDSPATTLAWVREMRQAFVRWQHVIGQVDIEVDGDTARATAYLVNPMVVAGPDGSEAVIEVGGYYHHQLVRTRDGWRSRHMVDELVWTH